SGGTRLRASGHRHSLTTLQGDKGNFLFSDTKLDDTATHMPLHQHLVTSYGQHLSDTLVTANQLDRDALANQLDQLRKTDQPRDRCCLRFAGSAILLCHACGASCENHLGVDATRPQCPADICTLEFKHLVLDAPILQINPCHR